MRARPRDTRGNADHPSRPNPLLGVHQFFRQGKASAEGWSQLVAKDREWESFYRERWRSSPSVIAPKLGMLGTHQPSVSLTAR